MNILITAGGNTEKIDDVRSIRNTGTGRLGALVAEKLIASDANAHIFYVCDRHAVTPRGSKVSITRADDVTSLGEVVHRICSENSIDAMVHSMAVSDYRVKNVTTIADVADAVKRYCLNGVNGIYENGEISGKSDGSQNSLEKEIANSKDVREGGKISSNLDDVLVVLERAPKIISLYRELAPNAIIVGFKLLADVEEDELVRVGYGLLKKNDCDYVLANDMKYLSRGGHIGHMIARDGSYSTYDGKDAIAGAIADAITRRKVIEKCQI
jgi:phosphopantothenate-cysteine ligase